MNKLVHHSTGNGLAVLTIGLETLAKGAKNRVVFPGDEGRQVEHLAKERGAGPWRVAVSPSCRTGGDSAPGRRRLRPAWRSRRGGGGVQCGGCFFLAKRAITWASALSVLARLGSLSAKAFLRGQPVAVQNRSRRFCPTGTERARRGEGSSSPCRGREDLGGRPEYQRVLW